MPLYIPTLTKSFSCLGLYFSLLSPILTEIISTYNVNMISSSIGTNINLLHNGRFVAPTPAFAWSEPHKSKG